MILERNTVRMDTEFNFEARHFMEVTIYSFPLGTYLFLCKFLCQDCQPPTLNLLFSFVFRNLKLIRSLRNKIGG